jgi:antitoxin VapB
MALNIKNSEVERLAAEIASITHETKTEAIRRALQERKERLAAPESPEEKKKRILEFFQREIWPHLPPDVRGKHVTKEEREEILGYGPDGV